MSQKTWGDQVLWLNRIVNKALVAPLEAYPKMHPMVNYNTFYMIFLFPLYLYNSNYLIFLTQNRSCSTIYPASFIPCLLPTHAFVIYSTHFSTLYIMVHSCSDKINLSVDIVNCAFTSLVAVITKQSPVDFNLLLRQLISNLSAWGEKQKERERCG